MYQIFAVAVSHSRDTTVFVDLPFRSQETNINWPNIIYPNNPVNGAFTLFGNGIEVIRQLSIYGRWGNLVWQSTNFTPNDLSLGWFGSMNGQEVVQGVYVWVPQIQKADGRLAGNVAVVR
jgi:hypothetical protein